jgi:Icc protein
MMERRKFLHLLGLGLAAGWVGGRISWPRTSQAGEEMETGWRLALLADAHLRDGDDRRPEAQALARAVSEIRALKPAPDLTLFAGDLAHQADPRALALGKEILSDLPGPLFPVMGEGDGLPEAAAPWRRLFGDPWFCQTLPKPEDREPQTVLQVLGLHAAWCPGPGGPGFYLGAAGRRRLARELACLDPGQPLLVLSHAPLTRIFRPWQQWTGDADLIMPWLSRFSSVLLVHGHIHRSGSRHPAGAPYELGGLDLEEGTKNQKRKTNHQLSLPATAWPLPSPLLGTPADLRPGLGPHGCGWGLVSIADRTWRLSPQLWQA